MCCKPRFISPLSRVSCPAPVSHALVWNRRRGWYLRKGRGSDSRQVGEDPHPQLCSLLVRRNQVQVITKWSCSVHREGGRGVGVGNFEAKYIVNGKEIFKRLSKTCNWRYVYWLRPGPDLLRSNQNSRMLSPCCSCHPCPLAKSSLDLPFYVNVVRNKEICGSSGWFWPILEICIFRLRFWLWVVFWVDKHRLKCLCKGHSRPHLLQRT